MRGRVPIIAVFMVGAIGLCAVGLFAKKTKAPDEDSPITPASYRIENILPYQTE
ncbi:MAG: hypothetical protein K6T63_15505 [Alicyclobacillus herbarius]|uniref:hypothetical protein n=1 Tax=Alicyclobacillus herbarius TaxID=122960 RepID=UPI0023537079|nr:hypothetical protein [Alicyclobacillus herbarius]MCL6634022.1 hypothetical protein [Alicyclobacillus herbarius]